MTNDVAILVATAKIVMSYFFGGVYLRLIGYSTNFPPHLTLKVHVVKMCVCGGGGGGYVREGGEGERGGREGRGKMRESGRKHTYIECQEHC